MLPQRLRNWPWLTLQIITANVAIILAVVFAGYFLFMEQSRVYHDRLMSTFNIEPGSLHAMYIDDVERQLWMSLGFGLMFTIMASVTMAFLMVKPIRSLAKVTEELRHGNYSVRSNIGPGEVGRLARTFNSLAVTLESEEQRRSQFLADLSHELRTPITSLKGYTEGLEDGVFDANEQYFALMESELNHLSALIDMIQNMQLVSLHEFDGVQEGQLPIASHLHQAQERWSARLQQKQLSLIYLLPDDLCSYKLAISTQALRQIFDNLLSNMYRYAESGTTCNIEVSAAPQNQSMVLAFSNKTLEVNNDCLPFLFDRFYRVSKSRTRNQQENSIGLGLSIVKQLCLLYKGSVTADLDDNRLIISAYLPLNT